MEEALVPAFASDELAEPEAVRRVTVGGADVLVARLDDGSVVAFAATCPHQRTDLMSGATFVDGCVQCPLHGYSYDLRTGENVVPTRDAVRADLWKLKPGYLRVYPVQEREGCVWLGREPQAPPPSYDSDAERAPAADRPSAEPARTRVLRAALGTTLELRLPTAPQPGFLWRIQTGGPQLAVVGERREHGDPPTHVVRLAARAVGTVTVRCAYARPWDAVPAEVRTYEVVVRSNR